MNKILTISIAAYNVEDYIEDTLKSILVKNIEDLEILVEDDGGTDNTANIVKKYEEKYPGIVKLVHKENGGYGSTINKSLELAQGKYFKPLDGDDWYDSENFEKLLEILITTDVDAVYTPLIECKEEKNERKLVDYFEKDIEGIYKLEDIIGKAKDSLMMHTLVYRTELLRDCNLKLLEHCFYTDTQYAMFPIVNADKILITHMPIYMYRIGRAEQSISLASHRKHYEDHVRVSKRLIEFYNENKNNLETNKKKYIFGYIKSQIGITIVKYYMVLKLNRENLEKIKQYEKYVLDNNNELYEAVGTHSKLVRILRKTNYNYLIYKIISFLKTQKIKMEKK